MASREGSAWTIGGFGRDDAGWTVSRVRDITEVEFAELERKARLVVDLASQSDYGRLLSAVRRFDALIQTAHRELEAEQRLSPGTAAALPLDFVAVTEAARRLEETLAEKIDAATDLPEELATAFRGFRQGMRASTSYLVVYEMADRVSELNLVLRDGAVHFEGRTHESAREPATALLGLLFSLVAAFLNAFYERFEEIAADLEREAAAVADGSPCLISYGTGASGSEQVRFRNIPLEEIAALRRFYAEASPIGRLEELVPAALALADSTLRTELRLGDVDIATGLVDGDAANGVNELPAATFEIDLHLLGSTPLDYWAPIVYQVAQGGYEQEIFAGAVQTAVVHEDGVVLKCEGAADLAERASGGTLASGVSKAELIRSVLMAANLSADVLALEQPASEHEREEAFEVLLPIRGLRVDASLVIGDVDLLPVGRGDAALDGLDRDGEIASRLRAAFADADSYARAVVTDTTLSGAEERGASAIEVSLAWLVTRGRYGFARLPDGRVQPFARQESLRGPQVGSVALVFGTDTGRRWLRLRHIEEVPITRLVEPDATLLDPPLPRGLLPEERHALLALRRATFETVLESQLEALWEAIGFYAAGARPTKLFTRLELKALRESSPDWLNVDQRQRFVRLIDDDLNSPSLRVRVQLQLEEDGVPLSEQEHDLLFSTLRRARNRPAHGKIPIPPTRAEIHRGISIVARMLVYRLARRGNR
jgi:hypothetical protein